jgi:hypothetical protein
MDLRVSLLIIGGLIVLAIYLTFYNACVRGFILDPIR